ncbi:MAG: ComF family protein [Bacteroidetes bacterium]|nr:ComF family protein [Bacteroidota bacterium]
MDFIQPLKYLGDLVYPKICLNCSSWLVRGEDSICLHCFEGLPRTGYHFQKNNPVERLFWARIPIAYATSYLFFSEKGIVRNLMHTVKYKDGRDPAFLLGKLFASELKENKSEYKPDFIVPVPLHPSRQRQRGFNQSEQIALGMAEILETEVRNDVIKRNHFSGSQTKKSRYERWENVQSEFVLGENPMVYGKEILLVDDVVTTGATMESCAQVLLDQVPKKLGLATLAMAHR